MQTIPQIKKDIEFNKGLHALIEVLKMIAVSQFRSLEQRLKTFEKLVDTLESFFEVIDTRLVQHPFLNPKQNSCLVIAVTSDVGLLGGLNIKVLNTALAELQRAGKGELAVIGERGQLYTREKGIPFTGFSGINEAERFSQALQLRDWSVNKILSEGLGSLSIVYPRALSITMQRIETVSLLPYAVLEKYRKQPQDLEKDTLIEESLMADTVEYLISLWLAQRFYEIFGLSRLAEFAARFIHLEESSQRLKDMEANLRRKYFRLRHEIIDRSMRELFTARSLYAG
jgi:ATP synthase F1 gamma subunit